jgi:hypothetical protein
MLSQAAMMFISCKMKKVTTIIGQTNPLAMHVQDPMHITKPKPTSRQQSV